MPSRLRALGRDGPKVTAVGLGFGSIGGVYGPAGTLDEKVALLEHAHATGLHFWDMADIYADSEDIVGEWIKRSGKRDDIFLATKFGLRRQPDGMFKFRTDPEYVKVACEKSLQRLGVDTIDLYYCHRDRDDIWSLRQQPRKSDLSRGASMGTGHVFQSLHQL